jgi:hypothetical protein
MQAVIELSSSQLLTLNSSPVTLIAAPGAGKAIVPLSLLSVNRPGTTPLSGNGDAYTIWWGSSAGKNPLGDDYAVYWTSSLSPNIRLSYGSNQGDWDVSELDNLPIVIQTGADASGPGFDGAVTLTITYQLADTT